MGKLLKKLHQIIPIIFKTEKYFPQIVFILTVAVAGVGVFIARNPNKKLQGVESKVTDSTISTATKDDANANVLLEKTLRGLGFKDYSIQCNSVFILGHTYPALGPQDKVTAFFPGNTFSSQFMNFIDEQKGEFIFFLGDAFDQLGEDEVSFFEELLTKANSKIIFVRGNHLVGEKKYAKEDNGVVNLNKIGFFWHGEKPGEDGLKSLVSFLESIDRQEIKGSIYNFLLLHRSLWNSLGNTPANRHEIVRWRREVVPILKKLKIKYVIGGDGGTHTSYMEESINGIHHVLIGFPTSRLDLPLVFVMVPVCEGSNESMYPYAVNFLTVGGKIIAKPINSHEN